MSSELLLVTRLFSMLLEVPKIRQCGKDDKDAEEGVIIIGDICICPAKSKRKTLKGMVETNVWQVYDETGEMLKECPYIDNAAIEALQHYVKGAAKGILDEMVCEGAAAWFEEERDMLKKAHKEGLAASRDPDPSILKNPYPSGTDFSKEWVKGYKAGYELMELLKPY